MVCSTEGRFCRPVGRTSFHCSTSDQAWAARLCGVCGCGWVEHFCCLSDVVVELGTLLGPEKTPVGVVLWSAPGSAVLTRTLVFPCVVRVVLVVACLVWGVVVC